MLYPSELFTIEEQKTLCETPSGCKNHRKFKALSTPVICCLSCMKENQNREIKNFDHVFVSYYITSAKETDDGLMLYGVNEELNPVSFYLEEFEYKERNINVLRYAPGTTLGNLHGVQFRFYNMVTGKDRESFGNWLENRNDEIVKDDMKVYFKNMDGLTDDDIKKHTKVILEFYQWVKDNDHNIRVVDIYNEGREYYNYLLECRKQCEVVEIMTILCQYMSVLNCKTMTTLRDYIRKPKQRRKDETPDDKRNHGEDIKIESLSRYLDARGFLSHKRNFVKSVVGNYIQYIDYMRRVNGWKVGEQIHNIIIDYLEWLSYVRGKESKRK